MASTSDTVKELQELRKGRGLAADDLRDRVGPRLRALCAVTEADTAMSVRRSIVLKMTELCEELDEDRKLAARVAFGLAAEAPGITLEDRMTWLASFMRKDPKTAIRRVDSAFRMLAEMIDELTAEGASPFTPTGWYNHTVRSVLFMDRAVPLLREERRIIATTDGVKEFDIYFSAPRPPNFDGSDRIAVRPLYGGEFIADEQTAPGYVKFTMKLPRPLNLGDAHEYGVELTSYPREWMLPYCELAPLLPCAHFYLRVKFDSTDIPEKIWRLNGVPRFATVDFKPTGELLSVDRLGELATEFHGLKPHLSYGVQWQ
ncbi:hypothetical protein [Saccharothrix sp. HUAS TT1]|uniref:hypothetical protein n=1 Tax=unclassified Saccharothrix TaxID=2593673 RepID=UPI00345BFFFA